MGVGVGLAVDWGCAARIWIGGAMEGIRTDYKINQENRQLGFAIDSLFQCKSNG